MRFTEINRSLKTHERKEVACRTFVEGKVTLKELVDFVQANVPRYVKDMTIHNAMIMWTDEMTAAEKAAADEWKKKAEERHEEWERKMYEKLKAKYE